ncbi:MAG: flippase-like domain-containing protein [Candidatus Heimdallarchaeota archaeon]|nr:MAG: flippase-like domain-containing protein [Candidatus Heimdallarchaeota archaeon]
MNNNSDDFQLKFNLKNLIVMLILFSLLLVYIGLIGVEKVLSSLLGANVFLLIVATIIYYTSLMVRSFRWKLFLNSLNDQNGQELSYFNIYSLIAFSFAINNIFPLRMGELYRPYELSKKQDYSLISSFATVILERTFDVSLMGGLIVISAILQGYGTLLNSSDFIGNILFSIGIVVGFILLLLILSKKETTYLLIKILNSISNIVQTKLVTDEEQTAQKVSTEVSLLIHNRRIILLGILSSLIIWLMEGSVFWIIAFSMNVNFSFMMAVFILLLAGLIGNSITSASGLGQLPFMIGQLVLLLGVSPELALSTSIVYLLIVFWLIIPIGTVLHELMEIFTKQKYQKELTHKF